MIGKMISHYQIIGKLGEGGMGEVFLADDISLGRKVALKFLPPEMQLDDIAHKRFLREARSAAALNHPYICNIHEVGEVEGKDFIVMEYVEGQTVKERLAQGPFPIRVALQIAAEIAEALEQAHDQGIIHRDLKPANIMLAQRGHVKVMDFGLAKQVKDAEKAVSQEDTLTVLTREGSTLGTLAYMSPEQLRGETVDARSDIFSFGIMFYEILTRMHPFRETSPMDTASGILNKEPAPLAQHLSKCPELLQQTVSKMLAKNRAVRQSNIHQVLADLGHIINQMEQEEALDAAGSPSGFWRRLGRPVLVIPVAIALIVLMYLASTAIYRNRKVRWAREKVLPEIVQFLSKDDYNAALRLASDAERFLAGDPQLNALLSQTARRISVSTTPPGADAYIREYGTENDIWEFLGHTPTNELRISRGFKQYKIVKAGYDDVTGMTGTDQKTASVLKLQKTLSAKGVIPPKMVMIDRGSYKLPYWQLEDTGTIQLDPYFIDACEVTNKDFMTFLEAGRYRDRKYWKHAFIRDHQRISWQEAMKYFVDETGRPGPSGWTLGRYPDGQDDYPVGGVSWYEAAAYAEFASKTLPTILHWSKGSGMTSTMEGTYPIIIHGNFGNALRAVTASRSVGIHGLFDMAGNVREWCLNQIGDQGILLGGSFGEQQYMFYGMELLPLFDRSSNNGFRCMILPNHASVPESLANAHLQMTTMKDFGQSRPVSDQVFELFRRLYSYERGPLEAKREQFQELVQGATTERISFDAAYENERVIAYLFIPKNANPPYQAVMFFPGSAASYLPSITGYSMSGVECFTRSGRAVIFPVYKGTFERGQIDDERLAPLHQRDNRVMLLKDLSRSIDYLETRPDIDASKIAFYGVSWGAALGPIAGAVEKRIRTLILHGGGFYWWSAFRNVLPECDQMNYVGRTTAPVLMLNGLLDPAFPFETNARVMFDMLGTRAQDKRLVTFGSGHLPPLKNQTIREMLNWLDLYLGPVR